MNQVDQSRAVAETESEAESDPTNARRPLDHPHESPSFVGLCIRCQRRLVRRGNSIVHEHTNHFRCEISVEEKCEVCHSLAIAQCASPGCSVKAHPACLIGCTCCERLFCGEHAGLDMLCNVCAGSAGYDGEARDLG